uniref:Uncharacterized protein n=1 Tax=Anopheles melas TaxID=34690 RepID=A0A182U807_9DIPT
MESKSPRQNRLHVPIHTYDFKLDKYRLHGMNGQLALVQALVLGAHRLDPQCPVAQVAQMLDQKPFVAAVRGKPDREQLEVLPPDPRYLPEEDDKKNTLEYVKDWCQDHSFLPREG